MKGVASSRQYVAGSADLVDVGNCGGTDPVTFTAWLWIFPTSSPASGNNRVMSKQVALGNVGFITLRVSGAAGTNTIDCGIDYTVTDASAASNDGMIQPFAWNFAALTVTSGSGPQLFTGIRPGLVNEISYQSGPIAPVGTRVTDGGAPLIIGNSNLTSPAARGFGGCIASAGFIGGRALDLTFLRAIAKDWRPFLSMHSGLWLLGQSGMGAVVDQTGNGFHGTLAGTAASIHRLPGKSSRRSRGQDLLRSPYLYYASQRTQAA